MKHIKYLFLIFLFPPASVLCSDIEEIYVRGVKVPTTHYFWMIANDYSPEAIAIMYRPSSPTINGEAYIEKKRTQGCQRLEGKIEGVYYACRNATFSDSVAAQHVCNSLNSVTWNASGGIVIREIFDISVTFSQDTDYYTVCTDTLERQENLSLEKCESRRNSEIQDNKRACSGTGKIWD